MGFFMMANTLFHAHAEIQGSTRQPQGAGTQRKGDGGEKQFNDTIMSQANHMTLMMNDFIKVSSRRRCIARNPIPYGVLI